VSIGTALGTLGNWLVLYPILDLGIGAFWTHEVFKPWQEQPALSDEEQRRLPEEQRKAAEERRKAAEEAEKQAQTPDERRLGAMIILGEIQYLVVATAVILTGVGAFAALAVNQGASNAVKHCIGYAATWALFALVGGVYTTAMLPYHTPSRNFVLVPTVNKWLGVALFMFVAAAARLLIGVLLLLG
jgi:hypothetical protein